MLYLRLSLLREPCSSLLGTLHPERNREDIAWFHMLHQGLIELAQEGKWVLCCLRYSLPLKDAPSRRWTVRSTSLGGRSSRTTTVKSSPTRNAVYTSCWYIDARRVKSSASLSGASRSETRKMRCPCPSLLTWAVILKIASNICCSSLPAYVVCAISGTKEVSFPTKRGCTGDSSFSSGGD